MPLQAIPTLHGPSPLQPGTAHVGRKQRCSFTRNLRAPLCAHQVFDGMLHTDISSWSILIRGLLADGKPREAVSVYQQMVARGIAPDKHILLRVLAAISVACDLFSGRQVHGRAFKHGLASDDYVVSALMAMYGRLSGTDAAREIFDRSSKSNCVFWTQLMNLYMDAGRPEYALRMFKKMQDSDASVDAVALAIALKACWMMKSFYDGKRVHEYARMCGLEFDTMVGNSIVKMYVECGKIDLCREFFDRLPSKDLISWTTLILWYVQNGEFNEGFKLFRKMCLETVKPDPVAITAILPACGRVSAYKHGREIHGYLIKRNVVMEPTLQNALIDMYVKSGCLGYASTIFSGMKEKDVFSWTIMILGYSLHRQGDRGVRLFQMVQKIPKFHPDLPLYTAALYACYAARMVEEGKVYFRCIKKPEIEHYTLMVGLLARGGLFSEAQALARNNGIWMNAEVQRVLLDGCRIHQNIRLGKCLAEQLIELEPLNAENYTLLANFHASDGHQDRAEAWKQTIKDMGLRTKKACSWIEFKRKAHVFEVGDVSHPRSEKLYSELRLLKKKMEEEGYVPEENFSLHEVAEERECEKSGHSEMLATAFGLISKLGSPVIRVTKNLRTCRNCHSSLKMISKIADKEIILKDPDCFHHFRDGLCSCEDHW